MKNKIKTVVYVAFLASSHLFVMGEASAAIYKCVNTKGAIYYNDKPCPINNAETRLKALKDPKGGYIPPAFVKDESKSKPAGIVVGSESSNDIKNDQDKKQDSEQLAKTKQGDKNSQSQKKNKPALTDNADTSNSVNDNSSTMSSTEKTNTHMTNDHPIKEVHVEPANFKPSDNLVNEVN